MRPIVLRNAILLGVAGFAALAAAPAGCSAPGTATTAGTGPGSHPTGTPGSDVGSIGMYLTLPGGTQIDTVNWVVTGPNGASTVVQSGMVNVGSSSGISFLIGGLPPGSGYTVTLSGSSTDGTVTCAGSATFTVSARTTSNVNVALQCQTAPGEAGSALVNGSTFNCGTVVSMSASPADVSVGGSIQLAGTGTGPDTSGLAYAWSASSGTLSAPTSATTDFTCTQAGTVTITLTVTDGPIPDGGACDPSLETQTVNVTCDSDASAN
ncbi:MAG TPA: hypothetical protein VHV30_14605 [Polyangiaceae bacterium]|jgi:hypothetical protein|nr:hypothetical protein [Polyangiaceae bacterium]